MRPSFTGLLSSLRPDPTAEWAVLREEVTVALPASGPTYVDELHHDWSPSGSPGTTPDDSDDRSGSDEVDADDDPPKPCVRTTVLTPNGPPVLHVRPIAPVLIEGSASHAKNYVRIVCISDTHMKHLLTFSNTTSDGPAAAGGIGAGLRTLPEGDVLLHAGDFTVHGLPQEIDSFADWLQQQRSRYKCGVVVIPGNHDILFDSADGWYQESYKRFGHAECHESETFRKRMDASCSHFVCHSGITLPVPRCCAQAAPHCSSSSPPSALRIFGSAYSTWYRWAFNLERGETAHERYAEVGAWARPQSTVEPHATSSSSQSEPAHSTVSTFDVLLTHGPPLGHGDMTTFGKRVGCADLLDLISWARPKLHVFGHIHEGYGATVAVHPSSQLPSRCGDDDQVFPSRMRWADGGAPQTLCINASLLDEFEDPLKHPPVVVDLPLCPDAECRWV